MVDVAAQIAATHPRTRLVAVSRHGLLPTRHVRRGPRQLDAFRPDLTSLSATLRDVRRRVAEVEEQGGNWRDVVDSLRPFADEIWADMGAEDRERFVRHVARRWEVLRHRMAPDMAEILEDLRAAGRLTITSWSNLDPSSFSRVVNCTGPAPVCTAGWNAVVDRLRTRELLRPDRLGLGVDVDATGALIGVDGIASPRLVAVGAARRGTRWEVAAIPDIRKQTARLATDLLGSDERRTQALPA
jgi:uncharacterized NAD(P)/FAD-binding protein YdhS